MEDTTLSQGSFYEYFMSQLVKRITELKEEILNQNFERGDFSNNLKEDRNDFNSWYRSKMKEITCKLYFIIIMLNNVHTLIFI